MNETTIPAAVASPVLPAPPRRRRWLTVLVCAALFVTGAVGGAAGSAMFIRNRVQNAIHHPEIGRQRLEQMLTRRLDLDERQRREVGRILRERQRETQRIRRQFYPLMRAELERSNEEIAGVLRPGQRAKWREIYATFQSRWLPPPPPATQPE
ncbi:MAG: hypothetical protein PHU85_01155 [Phycisphaerae bacterium]|nr:hypothetical protein [Phycisphaerae bacterium]